MTLFRSIKKSSDSNKIFCKKISSKYIYPSHDFYLDALFMNRDIYVSKFFGTYGEVGVVNKVYSLKQIYIILRSILAEMVSIPHCLIK